MGWGEEVARQSDGRAHESALRLVRHTIPICERVDVFHEMEIATAYLLACALAQAEQGCDE